MKKIIFLLFILLVFLINSGCRTSQELEDRALVAGETIDKIIVNGQDMYRTTVLVYKPSEMAGGGKPGGGGKSAPYLVFSAVGKNLSESIKNLSSQLSRLLFFAHSDVIIIGERLAREDGVQKVLDLILRNREIRLNSYIFIAKGEAFKIFEAQPEMDQTLSQEIGGMTEKVSKSESKFYVANLKDFVRFLLSTGRDAVTGEIEVLPVPENFDGKRQIKTVKLTGAAIFRKEKLVGWLNEAESRGLLFLFNKAEDGVISVKMPGSQTDTFSFQMVGAKTKIKPSIQKNRISFTVEVKVEGDIRDIEDGVTISKPEQVKKLEKLVSTEIMQNIQKSIQKSQMTGTDIFGFGDAVHKRHPGKWEKIERDWRGIFASLPVKIKVEVKIRQSGMISDPIKVTVP